MAEATPGITLFILKQGLKYLHVARHDFGPPASASCVNSRFHGAKFKQC